MSKNVLVVDDSKVSRIMIKKFVQQLGHEIIGEAENGELGFEAYKELKPDIVLSDVEMPVLDGYGMVEKIIAHDSNACVAMITSVVNAQIVTSILNIGALDVIKKPVNEEKLQKIFDQLD